MNISPEALFRILADTTRLRCLALLRAEGELCVFALTQALNAPQPRISRHLAQLRESGLVQDQRRGQWVYYRMNPDLPEWVDGVLGISLARLSEAAPYSLDRQRLHASSG